MKKMIVFDLDGTLTESKLEIDIEMGKLLEKLLEKTKVAVTGGGSYEQFKKQLLNNLEPGKELENLFIFPTNGASFYRYIDKNWQKEYENLMTTEERNQIVNAFEKTFAEIDYRNPEKVYGPILDDRGSQITFSALGQKAPIEERNKWNETEDRRKEIISVLKKYLPQFEIVSAGVTSIDVMKKGIDKYYAIEKMMKIFGLIKEEMVFVGDALDKGENDYAAIRTGVEIVKVNGPEETKKIIRSW